MNHKGFQLDHCRFNCPKTARNWHNLCETLTKNLTALNLYQIFEDKFSPVLNHHIPKITLAGCPNGCSQPNIKDIGVSGYVSPLITDVPCIGCKECVRACPEGAIAWNPRGIVIDHSRCLSCGDCQRVCPSGTLTAGESGWTLRLGGRVGRHPQFAKSVGQVQTDEEVLAWISDILLRYLMNAHPQERLTHFLERSEKIIGMPESQLHVHESNSVNLPHQEQ